MPTDSERPMRSGLEGIPRDLLPIRPSRACSTCYHSAAPPANAPVGAPLECRRRPPVVHVVMLKTAGMPTGLDLGFTPPDEILQALTNFPSVQPDQWCGEYEPSACPTAVDG